MIRWIPYTFLRITSFFIAGILLGIYLPDIIPVSIAVGTLFVLFLLYVIYYSLRKRKELPLTRLSLFAFPFIFLAGYGHVIFQTESREPDHILNYPKEITAYTIRIDNYAEEKENSWKIVGEVLQVKSEKWTSASGKVLLYFSKEIYKSPFPYGDVLLVEGKPSEVSPPGNPGEFDYKTFLTFRNTYHQHFLKTNHVVVLKNDPANILKDYAIAGRLWANRILHRYVTGKQERAIASALVLGVTDGLDNELLGAYAATGAMHVLAVSGLHISIIYLIILWLFKPVMKTKQAHWLVALISLILLWGYAFVTGLSPSVLRAVTMFTFIAIAKATLRNTNIYNTLAASCFCLLLFDPYLIMSVGFQLSYLAVLGIVYLQPLMYRWWEPRSWLMNEVWKITCVSVAAQLATFPLGLLYFHQFPNYFLLSNLLVIPVSFVVLILGIVLLAFSFLEFAAVFFGFLLTYSIKLLNLIVETVELFPFSLVEGVYITTTQCWLLIGMLVCVIILVQFRKFSYLYVTMFFVILFTVIQWKRFADQHDTITVYNVSGNTAIDFISGGKAYFIADTSLINNAEKIRFHIKPNRLLAAAHRVYDGDHIFSENIPGGKIIHWHGHLIVHITGQDFYFPQNVQPDLIVIGNNSIKDLRTIENIATQSKIVFDSSNSFFYLKNISVKAHEIGIDFYSVREQGAFVWNLVENT